MSKNLEGNANSAIPIGYLHPNTTVRDAVKNKVTELQNTKSELSSQTRKKLWFSAVAYTVIAAMIAFVLNFAIPGMHEQFGAWMPALVVLTIVLWLFHASLIMFPHSRFMRKLLLKDLNIAWLSLSMHFFYVFLSLFIIVRVNAKSILVTTYGNQVKAENYVQYADSVTYEFEAYDQALKTILENNEVAIGDFIKLTQREQSLEDKSYGGKGAYYQFYAEQEKSAEELLGAYRTTNEKLGDLRDTVNKASTQFVKQLDSAVVDDFEAVARYFRNFNSLAKKISYEKLPKFGFYLTSDYSIAELQTQFPTRASRLQNFESAKTDLLEQLTQADNELVALVETHKFGTEIVITKQDHSLMYYWQEMPSEFFLAVLLDGLIILLAYILFGLKLLMFGSNLERRKEELEQELIQLFKKEEKNLPGEKYQLYLHLIGSGGFTPEEAGLIASKIANKHEYEKIISKFKTKKEMVAAVESGRINVLVEEVAGLEEYQINELSKLGATSGLLTFVNNSNFTMVKRLMKTHGMSGEVLEEAMETYNKHHKKSFGTAFERPFEELEEIVNSIVDYPKAATESSFAKFVDIIGRISSADDIAKMANNGFNTTGIILALLKSEVDIEAFKGLDINPDNFEAYKKLPTILFQTAQASGHKWTADQLVHISQMVYVDGITLVKDGLNYQDIAGLNSFFTRKTRYSLNGDTERLSHEDILTKVVPHILLLDEEWNISRVQLVLMLADGKKEAYIRSFDKKIGALITIIATKDVEIDLSTLANDLDENKLNAIANSDSAVLDAIRANDIERFSRSVATPESPIVLENMEKLVSIFCFLVDLNIEPKAENITWLLAKRDDDILTLAEDAQRLRDEITEMSETSDKINHVILELQSMLATYTNKKNEYIAKTKEAENNPALANILLRQSEQLKAQYERAWERMNTRISELQTLYPYLGESKLGTSEVIEMMIQKLQEMVKNFQHLVQTNQEEIAKLVAQAIPTPIVETEPEIVA